VPRIQRRFPRRRAGGSGRFLIAVTMFIRLTRQAERPTTTNVRSTPTAYATTNVPSERPSVPPSALVPADAIGMLDLRWAEVRSDPLLSQFAVLPPPAAVLRRLGLSIEAADQVIAFSTLPSRSGDDRIMESPSPDRLGRLWLVDRGPMVEHHRDVAAALPEDVVPPPDTR
jgi:hypothetical protein